MPTTKRTIPVREEHLQVWQLTLAEGGEVVVGVRPRPGQPGQGQGGPPAGFPGQGVAHAVRVGKIEDAPPLGAILTTNYEIVE